MPSGSEHIKRCPWVPLDKPDYVLYHDQEWGVPVRDDRRMFEFLLLEGAQAGLSWYTVLRKRENYRRAFADFDPTRVARFTCKRIDKLLQDTGLVRNRLKIECAVKNARLYLEVQEEFGTFCDYIWSFVDDRPRVNEISAANEYPVTSLDSDRISRDLRRRGFKFVGSTIIYAHMQATGLVNDHALTCYRRQEIVNSYVDAESL
jgi:DNA-3-methyladenine glycosylase I